jgi:HAD superfamily hydrolase (TIGR01509 family)
MDGVILDSGGAWNGAMRELFTECNRSWNEIDPSTFAGGDNSRQWASYLYRVCGLPLAEEEILNRVIHKLLRRYGEALPMVPGAREAVVRLATAYRLGLASSSPREVIAFVLAQSGLDRFFDRWASSDDVPCGKPAPDVYRKACSLVKADPSRCVAVEDSPSGIRAARAAGLKVIAIPRTFFPLDPPSRALADLVLTSIDLLDVDTVESVLRS